MFEDQAEQTKIISSELAPEEESASEDNAPVVSRPPWRKIIIIAAAALIVIALVALVAFLLIKKSPFKSAPPLETIAEPEDIFAPVVLPSFELETGDENGNGEAGAWTEALEYLSFADFYEAPALVVAPEILDYELPLNVKIDVMNYYDVSRKINLDPGLESLNESGFALIDNPWEKEAADFFAVYAELNEKQLPLMITADFLIYSYQNTLKRTFKDIEENVFYSNLWEVNKELYEIARDRYEARLAMIGKVNDPILEGERLAAAFFATALELLKPAPEQIAADGAAGKFTSADGDRFQFMMPSYLRDDVAAELELIRAAKVQSKSPVLLYDRDYKNFLVPKEYEDNAKLRNFYLTTKWLNSAFPLNYQSGDCPDCLLDWPDWRLNFIAASFISKDFSSREDLKNKWARVYKVMSFFKGLREDLSYVHYRDALMEIFGEEYKIEELFDDDNDESTDNLEKLRQKLAAKEFAAIAGGLASDSPEFKIAAGLRILAESYWPNDYIFSHLLKPEVGAYSNELPVAANNITICSDKDLYRCSGFAFDITNLVKPIAGNDYFTENTAYEGYNAASGKLRQELSKDIIWQSNNYWATLDIAKKFLNIDKAIQPLFARSSAWEKRTLESMAAAWLNLQLPWEKLGAPLTPSSGGLSFSRWTENSYVEPNLALIDELMANSRMVIKMLEALQLESQTYYALQEIKKLEENLTDFRGIVLKELAGESLSPSDNEIIANFSRQFTVIDQKAAPEQKQIIFNFPGQKTKLKEDLSHLRLLVVAHREGDNKVFSVGPVWDWREGR
ncbi:MAG: DUF3160 domain-containing protein [Patescibacteria group bacterium]